MRPLERGKVLINYNEDIVLLILDAKTVFVLESYSSQHVGERISYHEVQYVEDWRWVGWREQG